MRFVTTDNKIQTKYYYNSATLVRGEDKFHYFEKENTIENSSIEKLRLLHKKTLIDQFKKYLDIKFKIKIISNFLMLFLRIDILRGFFYKIIKKI